MYKTKHNPKQQQQHHHHHHHYNKHHEQHEQPQQHDNDDQLVDLEDTAKAATSAAHQPKIEKNLIIVTGFGPFIGHEKVNASWEAVRLLPDDLNFNETEYKIEKQMIPVEYEEVDKAVTEIWARQPELVIHCGVHGLAKCVHIEKLAYNHKFRRPDYAGKRLKKNSAHLINSGCGIDNDVKHCNFNVKKIVEAIEKSCGCTPTVSTAEQQNKQKKLLEELEQEQHIMKDNKIEHKMQMAKVSFDVGDYLCGYIYIKSLDYSCDRSLFVHVPPVDKPFNSAKTSEMIYQVIEECIRQLVDVENAKQQQQKEQKQKYNYISDVNDVNDDKVAMNYD